MATLQTVLVPLRAHPRQAVHGLRAMVLELVVLAARNVAVRIVADLLLATVRRAADWLGGTCGMTLPLFVLCMRACCPEYCSRKCADFEIGG